MATVTTSPTSRGGGGFRRALTGGGPNASMNRWVSIPGSGFNHSYETATYPTGSSVGPFSLPRRATYTQHSISMGRQEINIKVPTKFDVDGVVSHYMSGDILFAYNPQNSKDGEYEMYTIWRANASLAKVMSRWRRNTAEALTNSGSLYQRRQRRRRNAGDRIGGFRTPMPAALSTVQTLPDVVRVQTALNQIKFAGPIWTPPSPQSPSSGQSDREAPTGRKLFTVTAGGVARVANLWPGVQEGDEVGFFIKPFNNARMLEVDMIQNRQPICIWPVASRQGSPPVMSGTPVESQARRESERLYRNRMRIIEQARDFGRRRAHQPIQLPSAPNPYRHGRADDTALMSTYGARIDCDLSQTGPQELDAAYVDVKFNYFNGTGIRNASPHLREKRLMMSLVHGKAGYYKLGTVHKHPRSNPTPTQVYNACTDSTGASYRTMFSRGDTLSVRVTGPKAMI